MKTLEQSIYEMNRDSNTTSKYYFFEEPKTVTCPVCQGKQRVPLGFYEIGHNQYFTWGSASCPTEVCRSCNGKGYINN